MAKQIKKTRKRSRELILHDLDELITSPGYIHAIAEMISTDFFLDVRNVANIEWRDRIHINELALLIGLLLKSHTLNFEELEELQIQVYSKQTKELLEELHWTYGYDFGRVAKFSADTSTMSEEQKSGVYKQLFGNRDSIIESTFYGDAGLYDMQCFELAPKIYVNDAEWLAKNTTFELRNASTIFLAIDDLINAMHFARRHEDVLIKTIGKDRIEKEGPLRAMDEMTFPFSLIVESVKKRDNNIEDDEIRGLLDSFSCVPGEQYNTFHEPGDDNLFVYKPIIKLGTDIYFFPNNMFLAIALYKSPLYWMRQDELYAAKANKHIGDVTEDVTYDYFTHIFGESNVYKNLDVYVGKNRVTDIDVIGILGNTAVIAQNKSKKMTTAALSGDISAIENDFQKAVIDPYIQGIKVRDVILGDNPYKLVDKSNKVITLPQGIEQAFIMCVSNEPYPAVMTQMKALLKDVDQLPPMQISLFDLDLMAEYLDDPYDFTYYIKQRLELSEKIIAANEIILLAFHIKYGLTIPSGATAFSPDQTFGQLIDADYYHRKKGTPKPKKKDAIRTSWSNKDYEIIIKSIKEINDPKKVEIIFYLKSLGNDLIDELTKLIATARQQNDSDGGYHDFTIPISYNEQIWGGITYVIGKTQQGVASRMEVITSMNKYRSKADRWLAFGAMPDGTLGMVMLNDSAYVQSEVMDEALQAYTNVTRGRQVRIVGD